MHYWPVCVVVALYIKTRQKHLGIIDKDEQLSPLIKSKDIKFCP
jgi:hypothetical protein